MNKIAKLAKTNLPRLLFEESTMITPGTVFEYKEISVRSLGTHGPEWRLGPPAGEFAVMNAEGKPIESITPSAFESVKELKEWLDEFNYVQPESLQEWFNRDKGGEMMKIERFPDRLEIVDREKNRVSLAGEELEKLFRELKKIKEETEQENKELWEQ